MTKLFNRVRKSLFMLASISLAVKQQTLLLIQERLP